MNPKTITVGPGLLTIGADTNLTAFQNQVTACRVEPSVDYGDPIPVLSGGEADGERTETWALTGTLLQDLGETDSRTAWLFAHRGEWHPFRYVPNTAAGQEITGEVRVEATSMGGDARQRPTSDFTFTARAVALPALT